MKRETAGNLEKMLHLYRTAGAMVVSAAVSAKGTIIYNTSASFTVDADSPLSLDINNDGTTDLYFNLSNISDPASDQLGYVRPRNQAAVARVGTTVHSAVNFSKGKSIGPGTLFNSTRALLVFSYYQSFFSSGGYTISNTGWGGQFSPTKAGYLGVRIKNAAGTDQYGWVSISSVAKDGSSFTIDGYAYEDSGNPIPAGAIPEPTALSLLAAGAAGLIVFRRCTKRQES